MSTTRQRRLSHSEQMDRLTPRWDGLLRQASLATRPADVDDCEEEAQAIAAALVAIWRGPKAPAPSAAPLYVSPCGQKAVF